MAVAFQTLQVISRYRVRLTFSNTLAAGAFATGFYEFVSVDNQGLAPTPTEAFVVPNEPNQVELTFDHPLVPGALYQLNLQAGVPATDASTAASAVQPFPVPLSRQTSSGSIEDADAYVFQRDLQYDGGFVESPSGDLATIAGPPNAIAAVSRRVAANGLPWDREYGAHARQYVDAPVGARDELRHILAQEALRDDRVREASVAEIDDPRTGDLSPDVSIKLIDDVRRTLERRPF